MLIQIDPENNTSLLDPEQSNPNGGWEIVRPLLEQAGYLFLPLEEDYLPGTQYNRETGEFYTPESTQPEPTPEELNNLALMEGIAGLYETQIALEDRMTTDNLTVMEGIAGLFEAQMGGV